MLLLWIVLAGASLPPLAADAPAGTDLALRLALGELSSPAREAWQGVRPLVPAIPGGEPVADDLEGRLGDLLAHLEEATGVDLEAPGVVVSLFVDLDAAGGVVWSAVVRGATSPATPTPPEGAELRLVEEREVWVLADPAPVQPIVDVPTRPGKKQQRAWVWRKHELAWSFDAAHGKELVLGNERGLVRQLQHAGGLAPKRDAKEPFSRAVDRLRGQAPVLAAFAPPRTGQKPLRALLGELFGPPMSRLSAGTLVADAAHTDVWLMAEDDKGQAAQEQALLAFAALFRGTLAFAEGGVQLSRGLLGVEARPAFLPKDIGPSQLEPAADWLDDVALDAKVSKRPGKVTEARLVVSDWRAGMLFALVLLSQQTSPPRVAGPPRPPASPVAKPDGQRPDGQKPDAKPDLQKTEGDRPGAKGHARVP